MIVIIINLIFCPNIIYFCSVKLDFSISYKESGPVVVFDIYIKKKKWVFNKAGKHLSHKFVLQNNDLECVSHYKYLGIWFNNSGSFNIAQNELYQKVLKALFKLKSDVQLFTM
jgi:hypothetical protein